MRNKILLLTIIFLFSVFIRFYLIDTIPGEWYGDITILHEYITSILKGNHPLMFSLSAGPLYHYFIFPIVLLFKDYGYETYKLASIIVSLLVLAITFLFVLEISTFLLAALTTSIMSFSFWFLIWSRLGNSQIIIPLLTSLLSLFIARYLKNKKIITLFISTFVASLGWYTYPHTFIFPISFLLFIILYLFLSGKIKSYSKHIIFIFFVLLILVIPFIGIVKNQPDNFTRGYVGEKVIPIFSQPLNKIVKKIINNAWKTALMLHIRGDVVFRTNVSKSPQVDRISGILFLLGFVYFWKKERRLWLFYLLFMMIFFCLPSISPAINDSEIPNNNRTIAIIPFVYILVAAGYIQLYIWICSLVRIKFISIIIISLIFISSLFLNLKLYFFDYTYGLPDNNLAPGKLIAQKIDTFPFNTSIFFASCCWGEWGEPEPDGIVYTLRKKKGLIQYKSLINNCTEITQYPALILFKPNDSERINLFSQCLLHHKLIPVTDKRNILIGNILYIEN